MKDEKTFFGGFEAVVEGITKPKGPLSDSSPEEGIKIKTDDDSGDTGGSVKLIKDFDAIDDPVVDLDVVKPAVDDVDDSDVDKDDDKKGDKKKDEPQVKIDDQPISDLGEAESDIVDYFVEQFNEELGWKVEEENKPSTVSDVVDFMEEIIRTNSIPNFANEEVEKLNNFVKDGGDLKNFYEKVYQGVETEAIDLSREENQRAVIRENLGNLGYGKERVAKVITRYEEAGTLEEEAEDALEVLKEYNQKSSEKLLENQKKFAKEQQERQQNFFFDVEQSIKGIKDVRGIPISEADKRELVEYIFKPEADGVTKYQRDYAKDYKNLIESAYFTMKGDSLLRRVEKKATSQAAKNLKDRLNKEGKINKNTIEKEEGGQVSELWEMASSRLVKKP